MREYQNGNPDELNATVVPLYQKMREYQNRGESFSSRSIVPLYQKMREYQNAIFIIPYQL